MHDFQKVAERAKILLEKEAAVRETLKALKLDKLLSKGKKYLLDVSGKSAKDAKKVYDLRGKQVNNVLQKIDNTSKEVSHFDKDRIGAARDYAVAKHKGELEAAQGRFKEESNILGDAINARDEARAKTKTVAKVSGAAGIVGGAAYGSKKLYDKSKEKADKK